MATATLDPAVVRQLASFDFAVRAIRDQVLNYVGHQWDGLAEIRDADALLFARRVAPVVVGGQRQVAAMTVGYYQTLERATLDVARARTLVPPAQVSGSAVRGVSPYEVYMRPAKTVWNSLSEGRSFDEARALGRQRALNLAATDIQLARTHTAHRAMRQNPRITGYRRVPTGDRVCALCLVAATNRYRTDELMPIHPGCGCSPEPIIGDYDPLDRNPIDLDEIHAAVEERIGASSADARTAADYRHLVVVREHGEIGPVLTLREHQHTGPDDL